MSEQHEVVVGVPEVLSASDQADQLDKKRKKRKDKVRSAWISFVGRIVAQVLGAAATIFLGLTVLQKYHAGSEGSGFTSVAAAVSEQVVVPARTPRNPGELTLGGPAPRELRRQSATACGRRHN